MNQFNSTINLFFALVRSGLWEKDARLFAFVAPDYEEVRRLAEEQSVVGLVTAGLERVMDVKVPQEALLQFIGSTLQIEKRNKDMNHFINVVLSRLNENGIYSILVKGQGVAQCYERPLWRSAGDIDLFLDNDNYQKAKNFLCRYAVNVRQEHLDRLHLGMTIDNWDLELHGMMHTGISNKINAVVDTVQDDIFKNNGFRVWNNEGMDVFLPSPDNDIIIVFTHFLNHFYGEGVGLRQICDWCRLLWTFKGTLNYGVLETRILKAGVMTEWKAFAAFVVEYLGMSEDSVPFYERTVSMHKKARRICSLILETGSFGQNKDYSYRKTSSKIMSRFVTFYTRLYEFAKISMIFPVNAPKFFVNYVLGRIKAAE